MVMAKIKVSQATIDSIKKMGMTKALAGASKATPEMKEALTRMYGARRVSASTAKTAPASKSPDAARAKAGMAKPVAKSADAARNSAMKPKAKFDAPRAAAAAYRGVGTREALATGRKPAAKPVAKKSTTTDPFAKAVFATGRAIGNVLSGKEATDRAKAAKAAAAAAKKRAATK
jgi:hypothetical protein